MVMGEISREYDLAVLGGGPAGYIAAIRAGQLGMKTVLIEKEFLGGTCLNFGCIPSKMLLNVSGIMEEMKYLDKIGVKNRIEKIDIKKLQSENVRVVENLREGISFLLRKNNVDVIYGNGRFESSQHIHIDLNRGGHESVAFRKAIIATGSRPRIPENIRLSKNVITSRDALFLDRVPKRLAIIGAGYIAAEIGTFYSMLGSEVHILARSRLLSHVEKELVDVVLKDSKINVHENCIIEKINDIGNEAEVFFISNGKKQTILAKVLVAIGTVPNTSDIGIEGLGIQMDEKGFIKVNEGMETSTKNIYAAGDVVGEPMLAHKAFMQGKVAAESAAGIKGAAFDVKCIPAVVFTNPEIAIVGMSEDEARKKGYDVLSARFPFSALGRAVANGRSEGFVRIVYERTGRVLGVRMVGKNVSELLGEAGLAIEMGAFLDDVAETVHTHPTIYESLHEVAELALGKPWHYAKM
ncbi:MAG: dihydrolipoyl dehydrogenase [Candidatus Micrarchaeia archaeon]